MKRPTWLLPLTLATACSSSDQSLGETRPTPHPIVVPVPSPNPKPNPQPNPNPKPNPNPTPTPDPDPNPIPSTQPCEDLSKHARRAACVPTGVCLGDVITAPGYECDGDRVCCDDAPGTTPCGGRAMAQGGAEGGDASAGAGGKP